MDKLTKSTGFAMPWRSTIHKILLRGSVLKKKKTAQQDILTTQTLKTKALH
jgi:hypothetical protein